MPKRYLILFVVLFVLSPSVLCARGAIAVDDSRGEGSLIFAIVIGGSTENEAAKAALAKCMSKGGMKCQVLQVFERCGAVAASSKSYGVGWGIRGRNARIMSLRNCGSDECNVVDSQCEDY
mgnify:CR=1 FL=1